jgi:hypothetical protein
MPILLAILFALAAGGVSSPVAHGHPHHHTVVQPSDAIGGMPGD